MLFKQRQRHSTEPLLPLSAVRMGRWVPDVRKPYRDPFDPSYSTELVIHEAPQTDLRQLYEREHDRLKRLEGTVLVYGALHKRERDAMAIAANSSTVYLLDNPDSYFRSGIRSPEARLWIEQMLAKHGKIYMIIGVQTTTDTHLRDLIAGDVETNFGGRLPVTAAASTAGGISLSDAQLDPIVESDTDRVEVSRTGYTAPGQQIWAIQYCRIRIHTFSKRKYDKAYLESETRWEYLWDGHASPRRGPSSAIEVDDSIEVTLATTSSPNDSGPSSEEEEE